MADHDHRRGGPGPWSSLCRYRFDGCTDANCACTCHQPQPDPEPEPAATTHYRYGQSVTAGTEPSYVSCCRSQTFSAGAAAAHDAWRRITDYPDGSVLIGPWRTTKEET